MPNRDGRLDHRPSDYAARALPPARPAAGRPDSESWWDVTPENQFDIDTTDLAVWLTSLDLKIDSTPLLRVQRAVRESRGTPAPQAPPNLEDDFENAMRLLAGVRKQMGERAKANGNRLASEDDRLYAPMVDRWMVFAAEYVDTILNAVRTPPNLPAAKPPPEAHRRAFTLYREVVNRKPGLTKQSAIYAEAKRLARDAGETSFPSQLTWLRYARAGAKATGQSL